MEKCDAEEQKIKKAPTSDSQGRPSVLQELRALRGGVQSDMKSIQERQVELTQKWASARTGMKRRKEVSGIIHC